MYVQPIVPHCDSFASIEGLRFIHIDKVGCNS